MSHRYDVVWAGSAEEAIEKSPFFVGQRATVQEIRVSANGDGTYTVFAEFELSEPKPGRPAVQLVQPKPVQPVASVVKSDGFEVVGGLPKSR